MAQGDQWQKEPPTTVLLRSHSNALCLMSDSSMQDAFQKMSILHNAIPHLDCGMKHHMYLLHTKTF